MRKLAVVVLLASLTGSLPPAYADPPSNDNRADATHIAAVPFTETLDVAEATVEVLEPMPCQPTSHTVWYSFAPTVDGIVIVDTLGSNFDTTLTIYHVTESGTMRFLDCSDDAYGPASASRIVLSGESSEEYVIQAGGWALESGVLVLNLNAPGAVSGTVTDADGDPLQDICVVGEAEIGDLIHFEHDLTSSDGTYVLKDLVPGDYRIGFHECGSGAHISEYYDDQPDWESADLVAVPSGTEVANINAALAEGPIPPPIPPTDLAVTKLNVDNVPVTTDYGPAGYSGWVRRVNVTVANLAEDAPAFGAIVRAYACPRTRGGCTDLGDHYLEDPGAGTDVTFKWNGLGDVGDFEVTAYVYSPCQDDTTYGNNQQSIDHYVIVGGTGVGISARPTPYYGPYPQVGYGCRVVIIQAQAVS